MLFTKNVKVVCKALAVVQHCLGHGEVVLVHQVMGAPMQGRSHCTDVTVSVFFITARFHLACISVSCERFG